MYFQQVAGEDLKLRFEKAVYGPYAENLRHVLTDIEGHYTIGYADGGDAPDKTIELIPDAVGGALKFLEAHPATKSRFDRVADLVDGFETPYGMELLATVHWVATNEGATNAEQAVAGTHAWSQRKSMFPAEQIRIAYAHLLNKGWISAA
jgi:hypothetical protein